MFDDALHELDGDENFFLGEKVGSGWDIVAHVAGLAGDSTKGHGSGQPTVRYGADGKKKGRPAHADRPCFT